MKKSILILAAFIVFSSNLFAHEGMWIPMLLKKFNMEEMHRMGFRLKAEDINARYAPIIRASDYYNEIIINGVGIFSLAGTLNNYVKQIENSKELPLKAQTEILRQVSGFFNEYYQPLDEQLFIRLLPLLSKNAGNDFLPLNFKNSLRKIHLKNF